MRTYTHIFNSIKELFDTAKSVTPSRLKGFSVATSILEECNTPDEFHRNWKDTCRKFDESDFADEAALTDDIIDDINTVDFSEIRWKFVQRMTEGDAIDVERYVAGQERCWYGSRRLPKPRQSVRIYINFGGNSFRSSSELAVAGAMGVTFAEIMESMGIAAEIWAVAFTKCMDANGGNYIDLIKLKAQNEYADMGLINFVLGDDGVFRNAMFRIDCLHAVENLADTSRGLGRSTSVSLDDIGLSPEEKKTSIIIPQVFDREAGKKWLKDVLNNQEKLHELTHPDDPRNEFKDNV